MASEYFQKLYNDEECSELEEGEIDEEEIAKIAEENYETGDSQTFDSHVDHPSQTGSDGCWAGAKLVIDKVESSSKMPFFYKDTLEEDKETASGQECAADPFDDEDEPGLSRELIAECDRLEAEQRYKRMQRNLAKCEEAMMWEHLQDLLGPVYNWPDDIVRMFWSPPTYRVRLSLCCFCHTNACDPRQLLDWYRIRGQLTPSRERHFQSIIKDLSDGKGNNWWSFSIMANKMVYMDGRPYVPPKRK